MENVSTKAVSARNHQNDHAVIFSQRFWVSDYQGFGFQGHKYVSLALTDFMPLVSF